MITSNDVGKQQQMFTIDLRAFRRKKALQDSHVTRVKMRGSRL